MYSQSSNNIWPCCEDAKKTYGFFHNEHCEVTKSLNTQKLEFEDNGIFLKMRRNKMSDFLQEGDVIELGVGHRVYANVPEHFVYQDKRGSWRLTKTDIDLSNREFDYLRGTYVVTKTEMTGGGTGHGRYDIYPDGHKVTAKMGGDGEEVSFYQSGCFTAMISKDEIKPVGKAKQFWHIE